MKPWLKNILIGVSITVLGAMLLAAGDYLRGHHVQASEDHAKIVVIETASNMNQHQINGLRKRYDKNDAYDRYDRAQRRADRTGEVEDRREADRYEKEYNEREKEYDSHISGKPP